MIGDRVQRAAGVGVRALELQDRRRIETDPRDELAHEPRLADARLAGEEDRLAEALRSLLPAAEQQVELERPADQRRELAARADSTPCIAHARHAMTAAGRDEAEVPLAGRPRRIADHHIAARCLRGEPPRRLRCLPDRQGRAADGPDDRGTGVDADTHPERHAAPERRDGVCQPAARRHRAHRPILDRARIAEVQEPARLVLGRPPGRPPRRRRRVPRHGRRVPLPPRARGRGSPSTARRRRSPTPAR